MSLSILDAEAADLWAQAELAMQLIESDGDDYTEHEMDEWARSCDPEMHVCPGASCMHIISNGDECVCKVTGMCFPKFAKHDAIAAGIVNNTDENGNLRCRTASYKHVKTGRSAIASSRAHMITSSTCNTEEEDNAFIAYGLTMKNCSTSKLAYLRNQREHLCRPKRCRSSKRDLTRVNLEALVQEAVCMFQKLITSTSQAAPHPKRKCREVDCENLNGTVRITPIHQYISECKSSGTKPSIDKLHTLILHEDLIKMTHERKCIMRHECALRTRWFLSIEEYLSKLTVCLWKAVISSPYMKTGKHTNDNFRPFIAGILFSTRRGITLPGGATIVPRCLTFASALPSSRVTFEKNPIHHIHLSAHKGVSTLHKSIHSMPLTEHQTFFHDAIEISRVLYEIDRLKSR